jgi:hypothetical protein
MTGLSKKLHAKAAAGKQQSITLVNQSFDERKIVVLRSEASDKTAKQNESDDHFRLADDPPRGALALDSGQPAISDHEKSGSICGQLVILRGRATSAIPRPPSCRRSQTRRGAKSASQFFPSSGAASGVSTFCLVQRADRGRQWRVRKQGT